MYLYLVINLIDIVVSNRVFHTNQFPGHKGKEEVEGEGGGILNITELTYGFLSHHLDDWNVLHSACNQCVNQSLNIKWAGNRMCVVLRTTDD